MEFAITGTPERFADVARTLGLDTRKLSSITAAKEGVKIIKQLCLDVEIPSISGLGIDKEEFLGKIDKMAADALASGSPNNTARKPSKEDIINIYKNSI
jgi:1,3-propanediol dehydrogenase